MDTAFQDRPKSLSTIWEEKGLSRAGYSRHSLALSELEEIPHLHTQLHKLGSNPKGAQGGLLQRAFRGANGLGLSVPPPTSVIAKQTSEAGSRFLHDVVRNQIALTGSPGPRSAPLCSQIISQNLMSVNSCLFEKKQMSDESFETGVCLKKIIFLVKGLFVPYGNKISTDPSGAGSRGSQD